MTFLFLVWSKYFFRFSLQLVLWSYGKRRGKWYIKKWKRQWCVSCTWKSDNERQSCLMCKVSILSFNCFRIFVFLFLIFYKFIKEIVNGSFDSKINCVQIGLFESINSSNQVCLKMKHDYVCVVITFVRCNQQFVFYVEKCIDWYKF